MTDNTLYDDENYNIHKQVKKKQKKGFFYWLITLLLIVSIIALIGTIAYNVYVYFNIQENSNKNVLEATEKFEPLTCDPVNQTVNASYTPNSLNINDYSPNELIGYITAPSVNMSQPILVGDTADENAYALDQGAAFDPASQLPQTGGSTVLAGHREYVFQPIKDLQPGDPIIVNIDGQIFTYEVTSSKVIADDAVSEVFLNDNSETLVLYTCYPFFLLAPYTDRYVVYAEPVESVEYSECE